MSKIVPGSGDPNSNLWFIGEAPAAQEVIQGKPFVGAAGKTLRRFLAMVGINDANCYFDNIYQKRAPNDKINRLFPKGQMSAEIAPSLIALNEKIRKYRPNLVVSLGATPTKVLTGKLSWNPKYNAFTSIQDWRGNILSHSHIPGQKVIPTFHPSYISREGYSDHGIFLADLHRIKADSEFPELKLPEKEFLRDPRGNERTSIKRRLLSEGDSITIDIEYIGNNLICVGMTSGTEWATSVEIKSPEDVEFCKEILLSGKPLNMQNAAFDASILEWHYDMPLMQYVQFDTMLAGHALHIELPKSLEFLASIYTRQPNWKGTVNWDDVRKGKQPIEEVLEYNCIDAWVQHEVRQEQLVELKEDPRKWNVFQFEMLLLDPLWQISKRGMRIDHEALETYRQDLEAQSNAERIALWMMNDSQEFNPNSGDQVADFLFGHLGIKPGAKTKTGKYKTDDKTLAMLLNRCKGNPVQESAINKIRSYKKKASMLSKFVNVKLDSDGRSRGMYNPGGTKTGRLASKKFYPTGRGHQQQNIPRDGRFVFIPDSGLVFGSVDYERAESLVVAHITNDPLMLEHHKPGADAHTLLGTLFFKKEFDDITKDERYLMKKTRHAGNYMEGHITFMRDVNKEAVNTGVTISSKQAKEFIDWYRDIHINLRPWWADVKDTLFRKKELVTLLNRPRTFFQRVDSILPVAVAYVPQGTIGDLMNIALLNLSGKVCPYAKENLDWWEEIPGIAAELRSYDFALLNQVHDGVGFQFNPKHETRVRDLISKALHIPLTSPSTYQTFYVGQELKIGRSWGEVE